MLVTIETDHDCCTGQPKNFGVADLAKRSNRLRVTEPHSYDVSLVKIENWPETNRELWNVEKFLPISAL